MHGATLKTARSALSGTMRSRGRQASALRSALLQPFSWHGLRRAAPVQFFATGLVLLALASEGVTLQGGPPPPSLATLPAREPSALPALPFVPDWRAWVPRASPQGPPDLLREPGPAPVRRLQLRWVYALLMELPEPDRVGRLAHVKFPRTGLSGGPELVRRALEAPREGYYTAQELTPGWSWYVSARSWGIGLATGTRFVISDNVGTVVDPFTSEARWAFFLP